MMLHAGCKLYGAHMHVMPCIAGSLLQKLKLMFNLEIIAAQRNITNMTAQSENNSASQLPMAGVSNRNELALTAAANAAAENGAALPATSGSFTQGSTNAAPHAASPGNASGPLLPMRIKTRAPAEPENSALKSQWDKRLNEVQTLLNTVNVLHNHLKNLCNREPNSDQGSSQWPNGQRTPTHEVVLDFILSTLITPRTVSAILHAAKKLVSSSVMNQDSEAAAQDTEAQHGIALITTAMRAVETCLHAASFLSNPAALDAASVLPNTPVLPGTLMGAAPADGTATAAGATAAPGAAPAALGANSPAVGNSAVLPPPAHLTLPPLNGSPRALHALNPHLLGSPRALQALQQGGSPRALQQLQQIQQHQMLLQAIRTPSATSAAPGGPSANADGGSRPGTPSAAAAAIASAGTEQADGVGSGGSAVVGSSQIDALFGIRNSSFLLGNPSGNAASGAAGQQAATSMFATHWSAHLHTLIAQLQWDIGVQRHRRRRQHAQAAAARAAAAAAAAAHANAGAAPAAGTDATAAGVPAPGSGTPDRRHHSSSRRPSAATTTTAGAHASVDPSAGSGTSRLHMTSSPLLAIAATNAARNAGSRSQTPPRGMGSFTGLQSRALPQGQGDASSTVPPAAASDYSGSIVPTTPLESGAAGDGDLVQRVHTGLTEIGPLESQTTVMEGGAGAQQVPTSAAPLGVSTAAPQVTSPTKPSKANRNGSDALASVNDIALGMEDASSLSSDDDRMVCSICMDLPVAVLVANCHHGLCVQCAFQLTVKGRDLPSCPFCRQKIGGFEAKPVTPSGAPSANGAAGQ